jgi:hypothetical protein
VRELVSKVVERLFNRFSDRRPLHRRAAEGVALVLVVGLLVGLGIVVAVAVAQTDAGTVSLAQPNAGLAKSSSRAHAGTEVITQTVKRKGKTVRVGRRPVEGGRVVVRTVDGAVTLLSDTISQTQTVTTHEVATVTDVQEVTVTAPSETVTVFETVTCKPKGC